MDQSRSASNAGGLSVANRLAPLVIRRWRTQGFDTVGCYPSGFCYPASARAIPDRRTPGYRFFALDSPDALAAVAAAIESGALYYFREMGATRAIPFSDSVRALDGSSI